MNGSSEAVGILLAGDNASDAYAERDITESCQLGVCSYISKPLAFEEFFKVVPNWGYTGFWSTSLQ